MATQDRLGKNDKLPPTLQLINSGEQVVYSVNAIVYLNIFGLVVLGVNNVIHVASNHQGNEIFVSKKAVGVGDAVIHKQVNLKKT